MLHKFTVVKGDDSLRERFDNQPNIRGKLKLCILVSLGREEMTHLGVPPVRSSLLELFVQLELDLCGFESALSLQGYEAVIAHAEHQVGLHHVAHLPGCKVHT